MTVKGKPVIQRQTLGITDIKKGVKFCVINPARNYILFGTFTGEEPYDYDREEYVMEYEPASRPGNTETIDLITLGMVPSDIESDTWSGNITIPW